MSDIFDEISGEQAKPQRDIFDDLVDEMSAVKPERFQARPAAAGMVDGGFSRDVVGIASESDKKARAEVDYLTDNLESVVRPTPGMALAQGMKGVGGLVRQAGDLTGADSLVEAGVEMAEAGAAATVGAREQYPLKPGSWAEDVRGGLTSTVMQAPFLVASLPLAAGGMATSATVANLAPLVGITEGDAYDKYRNEGFEPGMASLGAGIEGAIEGVTEFIPMRQILKVASPVVKKSILEFVQGALKYGGQEHIGETLATLGQDLTERVMAKPGATADERERNVLAYFEADPVTGQIPAWENFKSTQVSTATQNLLMGGIGVGAGMAGNRSASPPPPPAGPLQRSVAKVVTPAAETTVVPLAAAEAPGDVFDQLANEGLVDDMDEPTGPTPPPAAPVSPAGTLEKAAKQGAVPDAVSVPQPEDVPARISSLVDRVVAGEKDWSPDDLQLQQNYSKEIEQELKRRQDDEPLLLDDLIEDVHQNDGQKGVTNDLPEVREEAINTQEVPPVRGTAVDDEQHLETMLRKSQDLQRLLIDAGYAKGSGVSAAGLKLVSKVAKENQLRDWPDTRDEADYDALIGKVREQVKFGKTYAIPPQPSVEQVSPVPPTPIDAQAHEAATSPANDTPEPTPAQIEAGNYKKGHAKLLGLDISIENPAGSTRKGVDETGRSWQTDLVHHYGYIKGTVGRDKDHIDVFVKPGIDESTAGEQVFVVDQKNTKTGKFDEHKVMVGFQSAEEARAAYLENYDKTGPDRIMAVTAAPAEEFKAWLKSGKTKQPFAAQPLKTTPVVDQKQPEVRHKPSPVPIANLHQRMKAITGFDTSPRNGELEREFLAENSGQEVLGLTRANYEKRLKEFIKKKRTASEVSAPVAASAPVTTQSVETFGVPQTSMDFINQKVTGLGSIEAVAKAYGTDSAVDQYARAQAARIFGNVAEMKPAAAPAKAVAKPVRKKTTEKPSTGYGAGNQVFTADRADAARETLRRKLSQLNAGIDPEMVQAGIELAGFHIEAGARTFAAYSKIMVEELGEAIRPFLRSFYAAVRNYPGFDATGMESDEQLDSQEALVKVEATVSKKVKAKGQPRKLQGDYGVTAIDAYTDAGARAKELFLRDARSYLQALAKVFQEQGWEVEKPHVNPGGVAGSGDGSLIVFKPDSEYGAYVNIEGGMKLPGSQESPSGVRFMYRATTRKNKYQGLVNRWDAPWDASTGELAALMMAEVEKQSQKVQQPATQDAAPPRTTRDVFAGRFPNKPWLLAGFDENGEFERSALDLSPEERKVEEEAIAQITADPEGAIEKYLFNTHPIRTMGDDGEVIERHVQRSMEKIMETEPVIVNTDEARSLFQPYRDNPGKFSAAVHEPSSAVAKMVWAHALTIPDPRGFNQVLFLGGGGGSGKGSALKDKTGNLKTVEGRSQIIYDGTLNSLAKAERLIDEADRAGKENIYIAHVYRHIEQAVRGIVERKWDKKAIRTIEGRIVPGRDVPPEAAAQAHYQAGQVFLALANVADKLGIEVLPIDNTGEFDPQQISLEKMRGLIDNKAAGRTLPEFTEYVKTLYETFDSDPSINPTLTGGQDGSQQGVHGQHDEPPEADSGGAGENEGDGPNAGRGVVRQRPEPQAAGQSGEIAEGQTDDTNTAADRAAGGTVPENEGAIDLSGNAAAGYAAGVPGRSVGTDGGLVSASLRGSADEVALAEVEPTGAGGPAEPGADGTVGADAGGVPGLSGQPRAKSRGRKRQSGRAAATKTAPRQVDEGLPGAGSGGDGTVLEGGAAPAGAELDPRRDGVGPLSGLIRKDITDLRIPVGGLERSGSWRDTAARNLDIIELIRKLDSENRLATPDEQQLLMKYVGWGASEIRNKLFPGYATNGRLYASWADAAWKPLVERVEALFSADDLKTAARSSQYAHYTSEAITRSIWSALQRLGFAGGKVFEPGMGTGNFAGTMPDTLYANSRYTGLEFDNLTASIAKNLYPAQNIIHGDYTRQKFPGNFFDVAIGNPPFSQTKILVDPEYKKYSFALHDYFFAKTIDKVRPGGLLVFVTSRYTMDKQGDKARKYLAERADLIGAIRLPQTAFKQNSGTEVVTDVLFLRKRAEGESAGGADWLKLDEVTVGEKKHLINEYFVANPQMVLGRHSSTGTMYASDAYTVEPLDGDIEQHFAEAVEHLPANVYSVSQQSAPEIKAAVAERDFNPKHNKEGGIYLSDTGTLMRVEFGSGVPLESMVKLPAKDAAWLTDYVPLRDLMKQARYDQFKDGDWEKSLKTLNKAYAAFVKKHGEINAFTVSERIEKDEDGVERKVEYRRYKWEKLIGRDVEGPLVWSLERVTEDGEIVKGAFLQGRTIAKPVRQQPQTMPDALAVSLDELGYLDLGHIGGLMNVPPAEVFTALGDLVFETPDGKYELADEYLSGDVVAKLAEAEAAAVIDSKYQRNVKALAEVQPKPLGPAQVSARLGMPWIPTEIVEEFAQDVLEINVKASRHAATNTWKIDMSSAPSTGWRRRAGKAPGAQSLRSSAAEWGTSDRGANEILDAVLNQRPVKITVKDKDGKTYTDAAATARVNEIAEKMKEAFRSWVWTDAERAGELLELYNRKYNNIAPRRFDGSHLTLPGLSTRRKLHAHQKRAIWRMIQDGNTYLAHAVGAGKTLEMIAAGMEMKRLGLIAKPMYVVPNDQLGQWAAAFLDAYPLANIMVADEENFHTSNRRRFMAQAAMNAPDAIIITQSSLGKLRLKPESVDPLRSEILTDLRIALDEARDDDAPRYLISKMEGMIEQAEQRFDSVVDDGKGDNVLTFEDLGVDFLIVDEAHTYRKLDFTTVQQLKGVDPSGSRRALDLYLKVKWLGLNRPGRSHVFASGTPVTNTMGELYNVMRFFMEEQMERDDIKHFDAWAAMFGETAVDYELNAAGRYEPVTRFAKFNNLPELMKRVRSFMDVLTSSNLGAYVKRPDVKGGAPRQVIAPPSNALKSYQTAVLQPRMEVSKQWKPTKQQPGNPDPIINIITDGRLSSIDMRYVDPTAKSDPNSKLNLVIDEIIRIYKLTKKNSYNTRDGKPSPIKGGAQVVFYNHGFGENVAKTRGFDGRAWINQRLKAAGIPLSEVAWFDEYDTGAKKLAVQKDVREGRKKIIIGHAKALGVGKNLQTRLYALHYIDPPWYPADVEQPHGRIIRQGNQNEEVEINWYATKGSYDSTMWQMVGRKGRFIEQAFMGDDSMRSMEDLSEVSQYEMARALSSGDERIIKLVGLQADAERLQRLREAHFQTQSEMRNDRRQSEWYLKSYREQLEKMRAAEKVVGGYASTYGFKGIVGKQEFAKSTEFGEAVMAGFDAAMQELSGTRLTEKKPLVSKQYGSINGVPLVAVYRKSLGQPEGVNRLEITADVALEIDVDLLAYPPGTDSSGLVRRIINRLNDVSNTRSRLESQISEEEGKLAAFNKKIGATFEHQQALNEKVAELAQLQAELTAEGEKTPDQPPAVLPDEAVAEEGSLSAAQFMAGAKSGKPAAIANERFDAVFNAIAKDRKGFVAVQRGADLPARVLTEIRKRNWRVEDVDAVFFDGALYLVRDNITSEAFLEEVMFHEWHGHAGLSAMFGNKIETAMLDLYTSLQSGELLRLARKYNFPLPKYAKGLRQAGKTDNERRAAVMEELLAFMTKEYSRGPIAAKVKEVIGMLRAWLRENGFAKLAEMNEFDLALLLKKARAYAETGTWAKDAGAVEIDGAALLARLHEMGVTDEMLTQFMAGVPRFAAETKTEENDEVGDDAVRFHLRDMAERMSPAGAVEKMKGLLNPLDYSRLRKGVEKRIPPKVKAAVAQVLPTPYWIKEEQDQHAAPFYVEGRIREEERLTYNIRMRGGLAAGGKDTRTLKQRIKDFHNWTNQETVWQEIKRQVYETLSNEERAALDVLVVEGDARNVEYGSLGRALLNPAVKAAGVNGKVFTAYQALMKAKDQAFDIALDIEREIMLEAGVDPERVEKSIAEKRQMGKAKVEFTYLEEGDNLTVTLSREQATVNVVHQLRKVAKAFGTVASKADSGDVTVVFKASDAEAVREALSHVLANRIRGHMHRDHGDGEYVVTVHQVVDKLDFEEREVTTKGGKPAVQMFLPYYPGRDLAEKIEEVADQLGGSFLQLDGKGEIIVTFREDEADQARQKLTALVDGKKPRRVMVYSRYVEAEHAADQLKAEVEKNLAKAMPINFRKGMSYEVGSAMSESIREEEYQAAVTGSYALDRISEETLKKMVIRGEIGEKESRGILDQYREGLAETLLARGAGATMIRRVPYLIEGYERGNVMGNFETQLNGTAGMLSKAVYALRQYKHLQTAPVKTRRWAVQYIENTLRNMGAADRLSGDLRGLASLWYLGGNLTWMLINHTQPYVFGVAELSRHIAGGAVIHKEKGALRRILTAEKDIIARSLTTDEQALWGDPRVQVQIEETVMAEMAGSDSGVGGKVSQAIHTAARVSMVHGHKVEVLNRKIVILAAYRTFRAQGLNHAKALEKALGVNSAVNIDMGRYNLPGFAAKNAFGRTFYTLLSFTQHSWNYLYYRTTSGKREDQKAVLRLLFAMALLGGLPAGAPGADELDKLIMRWFGYSPKLHLRTWTRKHAQKYDESGEMLDDFVWHGIPGAAGVSLTGSVQFRLPLVTSVIDGDTGFRALGGAVGGLAEKGVNALGAARKGDYDRALEYAAPTAVANVLSATRQAGEGVKTSHGKPVFYKGAPLKMTAGEAILRAGGMQPARTADISETRGYEIDLRKEWGDRRQAAVDKYRQTRDMKAVQAFNKSLQSSQAKALVAPIAEDTLRDKAKPNKRQAQFQGMYGLD